jgi:hypothetical protein
MQQQLALEVEQELADSLEGLDERMRLRLPSIVRVVHRRLFHLYERADHMVRTGAFTINEERYAPQSDALADSSIEEWFAINESTFTLDSSLGQFPDPFSGFDTTYSESNSYVILEEETSMKSSESSE